MSWFRIDDNMTFHQKMVAAGNECVGAWVRLGSWCSSHLTDGRVPRSIALMVAEKPRVLDRLCAVGLLDRDGDDFLIHDYLDKNPSRSDVEAAREAEREKKRRAREKAGRGQDGRWTSPGVSPGDNQGDDPRESDGVSTRIPSHPVPTQPLQKETREGAGAPAHPEQEGLPFKQPEPPPDPAKLEQARIRRACTAVLARFQAGWVRRYRPADQRPPALTEADKAQLRRLVVEYGEEPVARWVDLFLADDKPSVVEARHPLSWLGGEINRYRTAGAQSGRPRFTNATEQLTHVPVTREVKL